MKLQHPSEVAFYRLQFYHLPHKLLNTVLIFRWNVLCKFFTMLIVVHASLKCVKQLPDKSLILRQLLDSCLFVPKVVVRDEEPEEDGRLDHGVELLVIVLGVGEKPLDVILAQLELLLLHRHILIRPDHHHDRDEAEENNFFVH